MHDQDFSLKEMVKEILKETKEQSTKLTVLETKITTIEEQVKKTNGRVTGHDSNIADIRIEQKGLIVKMGVAVFVASVVVAKFINNL